MTRVAVSILNYNSSRSTIDCVRSLLRAHQQSDGAYLLDIFVVDNGSLSDEQELLQRSLGVLTHVHLQLNSSNQGFAAGHNKNLNAIFLNSRPDFIWILNNDCLVYTETLSSLIRCAQRHSDVGIWGATLLESDGETIQCAGGCFYNSWLSSYRQYGQGGSLTQIEQLKPTEFDYISGASLFFPTEVLQKGLRPVDVTSTEGHTAYEQWFNEVFFLYFEELDLAKRLRPGVKMAWCKDALVMHSGGVSTGTSEDRRTAKAEYHSTLSALKFTRRYYPRRLWLMAPVRYLSKCLQLVFTGNLRLLGPLTRAYRDFWSE